jgi:inhibitor of cysteine peptidase
MSAPADAFNIVERAGNANPLLRGTLVGAMSRVYSTRETIVLQKGRPMKTLSLLACMLLVLAGCKSSDSAEPDEVIAPPSIAKPIMLTFEDSGQTIDLQVAQTVTITLTGNPTTGYEWTTTAFSNEGVLATLADGVYTPNPDSPGLVGVGGTYVCTYQAAQAGEATLSLAYARSWETDAPAKTFTVTFIVHE